MTTLRAAHVIAIVLNFQVLHIQYHFFFVIYDESVRKPFIRIKRSEIKWNQLPQQLIWFMFYAKVRFTFAERISV